MLVFATEFAREIRNQGRATRAPLLIVLRDGRNGLVTRDNLRDRDQIVAAITFAADRQTWRLVRAEESDALIVAAVESGATDPDPDTFADLDDTANDFAHVEEAPAFVCAMCRQWSTTIGATWSNAPAANPSAAPVFAVCPGCFARLTGSADGPS